MPNEELPLNRHDLLIQKMRHLGYQTSRKGTCEGVAYMTAQAILSGDFDHFHSILHTVLTNDNLKSLEQYKTDILPLLDGIQLHQERTQRHKHLIDPLQPSSSECAARITASTTTEALGGTTKIHKHIGIYTLPELSIHLASLRQLTQDAEFDAPFVFILNTIRHAACVSYDTATNSWLLVDANHLPTLSFVTDDELTKQLSLTFSSHSLTPTIALTTNILTLGCRKNIAHDYIQSWRHYPDFTFANRIDSRKAMMIDEVYHFSLLYLAVWNGNERLAHRLLSLGANPNIQCKTNDKYDGETPLMFAAKTGHVNMVKLLLRYGADTTLTRSHDHVTARSIAEHYKDKEILALLKEGKKKTPLRHAFLNARMFAARQKQQRHHHHASSPGQRGH